MGAKNADLRPATQLPDNVNDMHISEKRIQTISEIARDVGQVCFATVFLEPIVSGRFDSIPMILGSLTMLGMWFLSIYLSKAVL